ncbi:S8 family peptidase [Tumebacillus permanentifrigoris]|uniref:Subtilase family protein n=1 Tax=Tumebacillus permanentifrigoris TaxID=378543 RepID=A0A316DVB7_9BACL|nr:S8 family serine peptidase [Tumebacillus permanentifrigoris]PWK13142.1 subtilase family protein [Tumebacillus permanentifrigoris]
MKKQGTKKNLAWLVAGMITSTTLLPGAVYAAPTLDTLAVQKVSVQEALPSERLMSQLGQSFRAKSDGKLYQAYKVVDVQAAKSYLVHFADSQSITAAQFAQAQQQDQALFMKTNGKKTEHLSAKLSQITEQQKLEVGIWTADLPTQTKNSIEGTLQAKFGGEMSSLQEEARFALRTERAHKFQVEYLKHQSTFADKLTRMGINIEYQSGLSPFFLVEVTPAQLRELERDPHVQQLDVHDRTVKLAGNSISDIRADIVRDTYGYQGLETSGSATRIAVCEPADGDGGRGIAFTSPYLSMTKGGVYNPNTSLFSNHSTMVAGVIASNAASPKGIVPKVKLYDATWNSSVSGDEYKAIEWAVTQGVEVINQSYGGNNNAYDLRARWMDHIAVQHSVHVVAAGGNDPGQTTPSPAIAYNVVGVGAIDDQADNNQWNDVWYSSGTYKNVSGAPNKPDIAAPGVNISSTNRDGGFYSGWSGTSFAAPHVVGVIGQMIGVNSSLAVRQAAMKAILMAGAYRHAADVTDTGFIFNSKSVADHDGAGVIDALESYNIVKNNQWKAYTTATFPISVPFTVSSTSQRNRVAISWLKKNSVVEGASTPTMSTETPLSDLDLYVYDPAGTLVGYSTAGLSSVNNNYELVEFLPKISGTYTLKVVGASGVTNPEYVGVAWW